MLFVFNISTWSIVINLNGSLSIKNANLLAKLKGRLIKYLFKFSSFNKKINISLKLKVSGPPTSKIWPLLNCFLIQLTMISAKSDTRIGWNFVFPPPIKGRNGENFAYFAKKFKKLSSYPKTTEGLIISEFFIFVTFFSALNFVRAYSDVLFLSTPIAEIWISFSILFFLHILTILSEPWICTALKHFSYYFLKHQLNSIIQMISMILPNFFLSHILQLKEILT